MDAIILLSLRSGYPFELRAYSIKDIRYAIKMGINGI
jgi:hypothetical protein